MSRHTSRWINASPVAAPTAPVPTIPILISLPPEALAVSV
jgi:hypothetical protein